MRKPAAHPDGVVVRTVRVETILGTLVTPALLGLVSASAGLGAAGWIVGLAVGWAATALLAVARLHSEPPAILPADWVTLSRALLIAGVAGLVADSFDRPVSITALVTLATVALLLDAVDGQIARRTRTVSALGARFDGEVDAFLILLLSIALFEQYGSWVLIIGAARYLLLLAGWAVPWLANPLPARYWRKVVAAIQGIVLTVALSGLLSQRAGMIAVGVALVLLAESFGRDIIWLYRTGASALTRRALARATAQGAAVVVWAVLVAPDRVDRLTPAAFVRLPLELLVLVALAMVLPARPRRILVGIAGVLFGLVTVVKALNVGFYEELDRQFNPVLDWGNFGPAIGVVRDSIGPTATDILGVSVVVAVALVVAVVIASTVHLSALAVRHRRGSARGVAALGVVWAMCAALSWQIVPGAPVASMNTARLAVSQVRQAAAAVRDQARFERAIHDADPYAQIPTPDLLTGLRGKDVIIAFVEAYGQVAVQGTPFSPDIDAMLRRSANTLAGSGYATRSAFLTSPTFGGISWLSHSTLQSGLWVDNQQRYNQLVGSQRFTLSDAFDKAGWRTVGDEPEDNKPWPPGTTFYHYDRVYKWQDVGYRGPHFAYASMPDQYSLAAFQRLELAPGHRPVMAEIDLVSSHNPWTPLPKMVPWNKLGDGSIFTPMAAQGVSPSVPLLNGFVPNGLRDTSTVQKLYEHSLQYSLQALISWVTELHDPNLVLVMLGDEQPATVVTGPNATHNVVVSILAHDPAVLDRVASWDWEAGLLPSPHAPVWRMDTFRDRFLTAYGPLPSSTIEAGTSKRDGSS
jgi:phosphatidylglycerophosphate synthase